MNLMQRLRQRSIMDRESLGSEAADELDRLNAQALELCAEISGLRRENERLKGLLREIVETVDAPMPLKLAKKIDAALAGEPATEPAKTADQPAPFDFSPEQEAARLRAADQPIVIRSNRQVLNENRR
jgi:hypothetical protein